MGWWIFLGIVVLILLLPLGASIFYDAAGVRVMVIAGPVRFTVFPLKKKDTDRKTAKKSKQESAPEPEKQPECKSEQSDKKDPAAKTPLPEAPKPPKEEEKGGSLTDFLPLVELALKFVGEFFHKTLHIDVLYLKFTMAGDDPADLAINYGRTWAALGNLWPYVDRMFTIKKRDIQVQCDFQSTEALVNARVDITVNLARLLGLLLGYALRIGYKFMQILNSRKKAAAAEKQNKKTQS